jgi:hypothetical protein
MSEAAVACAGDRLRSAGTVESSPPTRSPRRRSTYGDEHAAAGRASGDRDDTGRSGRMAARGRGGRTAAEGQDEPRFRYAIGARTTPRTDRGFRRRSNTRAPSRSATDAAVRVDTGVRAGDEICLFDPMIAKLIVPRRDRAAALRRLAALAAPSSASRPTSVRGSSRAGVRLRQRRHRPHRAPAGGTHRPRNPCRRGVVAAALASPHAETARAAQARSRRSDRRGTPSTRGPMSAAMRSRLHSATATHAGRAVAPEARLARLPSGETVTTTPPPAMEGRHCRGRRHHATVVPRRGAPRVCNARIAG